MAERKVLNKYIPPDFDPSKLPRRKAPRSESSNQQKVRTMLPMSVRCSTCGTYMGKGSKFNVRMELVKNEDYLGMKIFRFYYKCKNCAAEFCMKTDPKSADYIVEAGATRNYEAGKEAGKAVEAARLKREEEERGDAMKALENRTLESKRELEMANALDEMKTLRSRHEQVDFETALRRVREGGGGGEGLTMEERLDEEDEVQVQMMLLQQQRARRIESDDDDDSADERGISGHDSDDLDGRDVGAKSHSEKRHRVQGSVGTSVVHDGVHAAKQKQLSLAKRIKVVATVEKGENSEKKAEQATEVAGDGVQGVDCLFGGYGSDSP